MNPPPLQTFQPHPYLSFPGCQKTQDMISGIMNQLMLRLGTEQKQENREIIQAKMNQLRQIQDKLERWKYDILFEIEHGKINNLYLLEEGIERNEGEMREKEESIEKMFLELKQHYYMSESMGLLGREKEELEQVNRGLEEIVRDLGNTKGEIERYYTESNTTRDEGGRIISETVHPALHKMIAEIEQKTTNALHQSQAIQQQIKERNQLKLLRESTRIQQSKEREKAKKQEKNVTFHKPQVISIEKTLDYKVLKVSPSKVKLGESQQGPVEYQTLQPKKQYRTEIQVYIMAIVFILLFHYVIY